MWFCTTSHSQQRVLGNCQNRRGGKPGSPHLYDTYAAIILASVTEKA